MKLMIEKDKGMPRVSRLRVIHLLEADYNFVLRNIWGRRLVKKARDNNMFMSAQQAQPGRLAVGGILNKVISFDLLRQLKKMGLAGMQTEWDAMIELYPQRQ